MPGMTGVGDSRRALLVPVTSSRDGFEHLVVEETMRPRHGGRWIALCGYAVWAAALACPPGRRCPACSAACHADAADGPHQRRLLNRRRGAWARWVGLLRRT